MIGHGGVGRDWFSMSIFRFFGWEWIKLGFSGFGHQRLAFGFCLGEENIG